MRRRSTMIIKPKKNGVFYSFKNDEAADNAINVIILASLHGDEVVASLIAHNIINFFSFSNMPRTIRNIIVYPFVNVAGIRNHTRESYAPTANLNDAWQTVDYRNAIKTLIDGMCGEGGTTPTIVIDIHNSPNIFPCIVMESTDPNNDKIENLMKKYNEQCAIPNGIAMCKRHTDIETVKSYVNNSYPDNAFGITFECSGMKLVNDNYILFCSDKITSFIRFVSENFNKYIDGPDKDFVSMDLAINLVAPSSGVIEYSPFKDPQAVVAGNEYHNGETIATIIDLRNYVPVGVVTAPSDGRLICMNDNVYVSGGECFGMFQPTIID
jgi:predicted deacylase